MATQRSSSPSRRYRAVFVGAVVAVAVLSTAPTALAVFPGANGLIAFNGDAGDGNQIYTIRADGTGLTQLTFLSGAEATQPQWSPHSTRIAFQYGDQECPQVAHMSADGSDLVVLPLARHDVCEGLPSFSADGQRLFYEAYNGHRRDEIWSMALDGSDRRKVSSCRGQGVTGAIASPDGTKLAFTCYSREGAALFVSDVRGAHLRQLTPYSFGLGVKEDWSPDSERIMFISIHDEGEPDMQVNTATIAADGTDLVWVTNYPAGGIRAYGNSYSPDGRWIVLRLENDDQYALYKVHPDGTGLEAITDYSDFRPRGMVWGATG